MEQAPFFSMEDFEEEKIVGLCDSLSLSPLPQLQVLECLPREEPLEAQPSEGNKPAPRGPKGTRQRRTSSECEMNVNRGHWQLQQNKKYHWFLEIHYKHFVNRHMRRMDKIFKTMETFIGTRQAEQCRSHHQKMEKKYLNFVAIITNLRLQHYDSTDLEPILHDISCAGLLLPEPLATVAQMQQQALLPPNSPEPKQRRKSMQSRVEMTAMSPMLPESVVEEEKEGPSQLQQPSVPFQPLNLLDDSNLNIGELMLYHQRDELSGLFNLQ